MFIYIIVNHVTGKYYIGQHKGNNLKKYLQTKLSHAKHKKIGSSHLFNSMRKHPKTVWSIHALLSGVRTRPELDAAERDFITFLKSQNPEYGYNICRGGEGFTGTHTEEWKRKAAERMKGNNFAVGVTHTEEWKRKISEASRGDKNSFYGQKHSEKTLAIFAEHARARNLKRWSDPNQRLELSKRMKNNSYAKDEHARMKLENPEAYKKRQQAAASAVTPESRDKGRHIRWHARRGIISKDCNFCR